MTANRHKWQLSAWKLLSPEAIENLARQLEARPRVGRLFVGRSHLGHAIPCLEFKPEATSDTIESSPTVMLTGGTFGSEASETEALFQVADLLTTDSRFDELLSHLTVVIIPCINPDGRARAIRTWKKYPFSATLNDQYNGAGFLLNRDFFHLTQPETRFVHSVFNSYRPIVVLDLHEDIYGLGVTMEETCWCPPFKSPIHPFVSDSIIEGIEVLGSSIASAWETKGFRYLHDCSGDRSLLSLARPGRLHLDVCLHNVVALITESSRTPGVQSWEDRIEQKVSACLAVLDEVAENLTLYQRLVLQAGSYVRSSEAYVIPLDNPRDELGYLLRVLRGHHVEVNRISRPIDGFSVTLNQENDKLARVLLDDTVSDDALPKLLGLRGVVRVADNELVSTTSATSDSPEAKQDQPSVPAGSHTSIPRGTRRVREACSVLRSGGSVSFPASQKVETAQKMLTAPPRIAIYSGPGVLNQYAESLGWTKYALAEMSMDFVLVSAPDIHAGVLRDIDLLIITGGNAREILTGTSDPTRFRQAPWQRKAPTPCLGGLGVEKIEQYMECGGTYLGIGTGGGSLLCAPYTDILDIEEIERNHVEGLLSVRLLDADSPYFIGVTTWQDGIDRVFSAVCHCSSETGGSGGPLLRVEGNAQVHAAFRSDATESQTLNSTQDGSSSEIPAVVSQRIGDGQAIVLVFEPAFWGITRNTALILANAGLSPVSDGSDARDKRDRTIGLLQSDGVTERFGDDRKEGRDYGV